MLNSPPDFGLIWASLSILAKDTNHPCILSVQGHKAKLFSGALLPYAVTFIDPGPRSVLLLPLTAFCTEYPLCYQSPLYFMDIASPIEGSSWDFRTVFGHFTDPKFQTLLPVVTVDAYKEEIVVEVSHSSIL